jgi:hypothetical protein
MSLTGATVLTAVETMVLALITLVSVVYTLRDFQSQSDQVKILSEEAKILSGQALIVQQQVSTGGDPLAQARPLRFGVVGHPLAIKCQDRSADLAGFWPDKADQYRSTMRISGHRFARSRGVCPGRRRSRRYGSAAQSTVRPGLGGRSSTYNVDLVDRGE